MIKQVECRSCTPRMNGTPLSTSTSRTSTMLQRTSIYSKCTVNLESSSIFHQVIVDAKLQQSSSKNLRCRRCHRPHHPLSSNFHSVNRSFARRLRSPSLMNRMGMSGEDSCSNACLQDNHVATTNVSSKHHTMHIYYFRICIDILYLFIRIYHCIHIIFYIYM